MSAIRLTPEVNIEVKDILSGISKLETPDLELFLKEVAHILARRKTKSLSKRETALLTVINQPLLNKNKQGQYDLLYAKLRDESITDKEQAQLETLTNEQEAHATKRLAALVELSQLQNISLDELMAKLGINATPSQG